MASKAPASASIGAPEESACDALLKGRPTSSYHQAASARRAPRRKENDRSCDHGVTILRQFPPRYAVNASSGAKVSCHTEGPSSHIAPLAQAVPANRALGKGVFSLPSSICLGDCVWQPPLSACGNGMGAAFSGLSGRSGYHSRPLLGGPWLPLYRCRLPL